MFITPTDLPEVVVIEPKLFQDDRGFFMESFNRARFGELIGRDIDFVQDNHSRSSRGVLRGLHYQLEPAAQAKLVRVVVGEVYDVAVDLRHSSPNFGKWVGVYLSAENRKQLWIPEGFGHGFLTMTDVAEVLYKSGDFYSVENERSLAWNDPDIAIQWPLEREPVVAHKDAIAPKLRDAETFA